MDNKGFRALAVGALVACLVALALGGTALSKTQKFGGASHFSELSIVGNQTVGGTFTVTGATTLGTANITTGNITTVVGTTVSSTNIGTQLYSTLNGLVINGTTANLTTVVGTTVSSTNIGTVLYSTLNGLTANITTGNVTTLIGTTVSSTNIGTLAYSTLNGLVVNATTASSTNLVVGQGTAMDKLLSTSVTVDPDNLIANNCTNTSIALTGVAAGDAVAIGLPSAWAVSSTNPAVNFRAAAGTNAVDLNFCNASSGGAVNLTSQSVRVTTFSF